MNQEKAPLVEGLLKHVNTEYSTFHVPGHQGGRNIDHLLRELLKDPFKIDLTELPNLDNLYEPRGIIYESQRLAAEVFRARETFFMVNGTTGGLLTMINTVCLPGDKIIIPRQSHQGVFGAIITSGAVPVYVSSPGKRVQEQKINNISLKGIEEALDNNPDAKALLLNNPTYFGFCSDLCGIRELTAKKGVFLLVDEAHGGHLSFHESFPRGAAQAGADMWVQSTHKTLGSLTQSSMLHLGTEEIDRARLVNMARIFQTTSPSYILLASLDAARRKLALEGGGLMESLYRLAEKAREKVSDLGFSLLPLKKGELSLDITKMALFTHGFEESGRDIASMLQEKCRLQVELSAEDHILIYFTLGHREKDLEYLIESLGRIREKLNPKKIWPEEGGEEDYLFPLPPALLSPREAVNQPGERVPMAEAEGRISAETVSLFPPGIPLLVPGELITRELLDRLSKGERQAFPTQIKVIKKE